MWLKLRGGAYLSQGQIIRTAIENGYVDRAFRDISALRLSSILWLYWISVVIALFVWSNPGVVAAAAVAGIAGAVGLVASRHRSLGSGLFSVLNLHLLAFSAVPGFIKSRRSPSERIASRVLKESPPPQDCSSYPARGEAQLRAGPDAYPAEAAPAGT